jgi:membrane protein required for colicin V production
MNLATLDWIFLAVVLLSVLLGVWRGLVHEVLAIIGWIAAFVLSQMYGAQVGQMLPMQGASAPLRYAGGCVAVFIGTLIACGLLMWLVKKMIASVGLSPVDRVLGAAFGMLRGLMILLAVSAVVLMTPLKNSQSWAQSSGAGVLSNLLKTVQPLLPQGLTQYLQTAGAHHPSLGLQICVES